MLSEDSRIDFAVGNIFCRFGGVSRMFLKFWEQSVFEVKKLPEKACQKVLGEIS